LADYRASERAFQILLQVAGRAGRGSEPGRVIMQTYSPEHPVIEAVQRQQYAPFAEQELTHRQNLGYPPYRSLVLLRLSGMDNAAVQRTAETLAAQLAQQLPQVDLLGPAPAAIARVANRYRWQILLKSDTFSDADREILKALRSHVPTSVSLTIDVDPLNLM
jgi:replication restart DNA helicase PriA